MIFDSGDDYTRPFEFIRHGVCFFMCYDVRPQMARFLRLLALVLASIFLFFVARGVCPRHMRPEFGALHWIALLLLVLAHVAFIGLKYDDSASRSTDSNIDSVMVRIAAAALVVCLSLCIGGSLLMGHWFVDPVSQREWISGPGQEHASPSPAPASDSGGLIPNPFKSPSRTPSHTPTSSPNPAVRMREFQRDSDIRATVGGIYLLSLLSGCLAVPAHYHLRMLEVAY